MALPRMALASFLDFFAALFSFGVKAAFFLFSLLFLCSLLMAFTPVNASVVVRTDMPDPVGPAHACSGNVM